MSAPAEKRPRGSDKRRRLAVGLKLAYPDDQEFLARFDDLRAAYGQNAAGDYARRSLLLGSAILSGQPIEPVLLAGISAAGYNNGSNTHSNTSGVGSDNESRYDPPPETESGPGNSEVGGERGVTRTQLLRGLQQQPHTPRHEG